MTKFQWRFLIWMLIFLGIGASLGYAFGEQNDYLINVRVNPDSQWNYVLCWYDKGDFGDGWKFNGDTYDKVNKGLGCEIVVTDESLLEKYKAKAIKFLEEYKK